MQLAFSFSIVIKGPLRIRKLEESSNISRHLSTTIAGFVASTVQRHAPGDSRQSPEPS